MSLVVSASPWLADPPSLAVGALTGPPAILTTAAVLILDASLGVSLNPATLAFPNNFENAAWAKTACTVSANATTDPLGGNTADGLVEDMSTGAHTIQQNAASYSAAPITLTVYLKAGSRSWAIVQNGGTTAYVNLATGAKGTGGGSEANLTVTSAGNGWWLCTLVC
jgi:hypothetical protein